MSWDTPRRDRFKTLVQARYSLRYAAELVFASKSIARYWLRRPNRVQKPPGAKPKIPDEKVQEIIDWFTGYYNRRTSYLKAIREQFNLDYCDNTLLATLTRKGYYLYP
jgi:transposase